MTVPSLASAATSNSPLQRYVVEPMGVEHIPAVTIIEQLSFSTTWPPSAYRREIERNQLAQYLVAKRTPLAGAPRREPRFPIAQPEPPAENPNLLARVASYFRADPPAFSPTEAQELETVVGFAGLWLMVDVAHITTIAVDPPYRGEGVGELLFVALLDHSMSVDAGEATLECRVSNYVAQRLYRKYTFRGMGIRRHYYSDDGEDALIMTSESLQSRTFRIVLEDNRRRLTERMEARA
jgi:ribosomal-protein-alanine N-acetyltransferase